MQNHICRGCMTTAKYPLEIYEDELYISYLSRIYARYGFIEPSAFNKTVFCNPRKNANLYFVNLINNGILSVSIDELARHSLLNTQILFNSEANAIWKSIRNSDRKYQRLDIGISTANVKPYVRYCPKCAKEQEERYFKVVDQILPICLVHRCLLVDSSVKSNSKTTISHLSFMELPISDKIVDCTYSQMQINYYSYIDKVVRCDTRIFTKNTVADYLADVLIAKGYSNLRQDRLKVTKFYRECKTFYSSFDDFRFVSLSSFKAIFKNLSYSIFTISMIGFYLGIKPEELALHSIKTRKFRNVEKIKEMYVKGYSQEQIAKMYKCSRQNISKIILDKY